MLNMVKLAVNRRPMAFWARSVGIDKADIGYQVHSLLAAAFGEAMPRPFSLRLPQRPDIDADPTPFSVMGYSKGSESELRARLAETSEPDVAAAVGGELYVKPMPESWQTGRIFAFETRICPVRRFCTDKGRGEHDAFVAEVRKRQRDEPVDRARVYLDWLRERARGCDIIQADMAGFRQQSLYRRDRDRKLRQILLPDALFHGLLRVTDAEAFAGLVASGLGRHRAFGYGMLLLRAA